MSLSLVWIVLRSTSRIPTWSWSRSRCKWWISQFSVTLVNSISKVVIMVNLIPYTPGHMVLGVLNNPHIWNPNPVLGIGTDSDHVCISDFDSTILSLVTVPHKFSSVSTDLVSYRSTRICDNCSRKFWCRFGVWGFGFLSYCLLRYSATVVGLSVV